MHRHRARRLSILLHFERGVIETGPATTPIRSNFLRRPPNLLISSDAVAIQISTVKRKFSPAAASAG